MSGVLASILPAGLARRLARAFVGLVAAALVLNGAISMWLSYEEATASAVGVQREKALAAAERVAQFVGEIEGQIGWTTRAEWARVPAEQRRYDFIRLLRQAPAVTEALHIDGQGREQLRLSRLEPDVVGSGADLSADPRFARAVADRVWYGPVYFRRGSEPYMTLSLAHAGRNPGVTSVGVNLKLVWDVITGVRVGEQGYAYVTDSAGKLIAHPDMSLVLRDTDLARLQQVAAAIRAGAGRSAGTALETVNGPDGRAVLAASAPVPKLGWFVFVELPRREVLAPVLASFYQTLALLGVGAMVALLLGGWLARRMAAPIRALEAGAQGLGAGDLTQRVAVESRDEIGRLAERFNAMAGRIQEAQETLEHKVEDRTRELAEALEYQTATSDVLGVISRSPSEVQPVLDAIIGTALRLCDARYGLILALQPDGLYHFAASAEAESAFVDYVRSNPIRAGDGSAVGIVAAEKRTLHLPDALADPRFTDLQRQRQSLARTMLAVPLLRDDTVAGVIFLAHTEVKPFSDRQIALVETFADQAVIAIENARLFEEVQARTRDLGEALEQQTATAEVLKVISRSAFDLPTVLGTLAESAGRLCDAPQGAIFLREGEAFRAAATFGIDAAYERYLKDTTVAPGRDTITPRVALSGRVEHVPDISADTEFVLPATPDVHPMRAVLGVPLLREGRVEGVFSLTRPEPGPFTERQIGLVQTFADQALIAIENARLFEEVQARTKELQETLEFQTATSDVLGVISRSPSQAQPIFETIVATASRLCHAEQSFLMMFDGGLARAVASSNDQSELTKYIAANPLPLNASTLTGRVALSRRTVHLPDCLADPDYAPTDHQKVAGYRTMLGVPLLRDGTAIGSISLLRTVVEPFTDKQIALVETFADQAVIALENARLFDELQARTKELQQSLDDLRAAQDRLVQTEKLASLGQLTAGIAHEIKNPLNFVNNFSELSVELVDELQEALTKAEAAMDPAVKAETAEIAAMLKGNLGKVIQHGKRADSIVKNMLAHSREGGGEKRSVDLNATVDEALNLAYHGARAEKPGFNITLERDYDPAAGAVELYPQEFSRVLLNLIGNGFHAAHKKAQESNGAAFRPTLRVSTRRLKPNRIEVSVRDNGTGIPASVKAHIFEPFFTTKPAGEGTGLGLSLSHDIIVKQHGGSIDVATEPGAFTEFTISLPAGARPARRAT